MSAYKTGDRINVWDRPNQHGKRRTAELLRAICRVGDRETWEARVDDKIVKITIPYHA